MTFKRTACISLSLLAGISSIVLGVLVCLFFSSLIDAFIKSELPLRKGSEPFELWRKPPVTPLLKAWFFNVTNADEFLSNATMKLKLKECGPYVYSERWEKVGVEWHPNGTLSYRQKKLYFFEPTLSMGAENDTFLLPNVPMLSAVGQMSHSTKIVKKAVSTLLDILKLQPFTAHTVKELMWGYEDPLIKLGKQVLPEGKRVPYDKFGFFVEKNNTESKVFTVFTGQENLEDFARIDVYNGEKSLDFWGTDACNMINGTDATGFPSSLTNESDIYIFQPDLCRSLHLRYNASVKHQGLPAFRFMPTESTFGDVETYPENKCFCVGGPPCARRGLFNISTCQFGSPVFISFPHFLHGDPSLLDAVEGLKPDPLRHQFYIDIQPKLGIAMQAKGRVQINIQMSRVEEIPQTANLQNVLIPVLWFEDGIDELPPKITALINQAIHTPEIAKDALSYVTFILGGLLILCGIMYMVRSSYSRKETMNANGHPKGDMEKTNGVTNGQLKNQYTNNAMVEMDGNLKNGKNKDMIIESTLSQKPVEGGS